MNTIVHPLLTAVGSGKGGTGKTLVSLALARALSDLGERVLLFDADVGLANTVVQLGLDNGGDVSAILMGAPIEQQHVAAVDGGAERRRGFDLLAPPPGSGALADMPPELAQTLVRALRYAKHYDCVILDLAAGVDSTTMTFAAASDSCLLVMTPDPAALADAYAFVKLVLKRGGVLPRSLVNMVSGEAEARRVADSLARTALAFLHQSPETAGFIPRDTRVCDAIRRQRQLLDLFPGAPAARALSGIAQRLVAATQQRIPRLMSVR